jgi:hypothetical protein
LSKTLCQGKELTMYQSCYFSCNITYCWKYKKDKKKKTWISNSENLITKNWKPIVHVGVDESNNGYII